MTLKVYANTSFVAAVLEETILIKMQCVYYAATKFKLCAFYYCFELKETSSKESQTFLSSLSFL